MSTMVVISVHEAIVNPEGGSQPYPSPKYMNPAGYVDGQPFPFESNL